MKISLKNISTPKLAIGLAAFSLLFLAKNYFNGGVCKVKRNLTGKVAIVTGGNTGIGRETALGLARQGCTVVIAARDTDKSKAAVEYIRKHSGNMQVEWRRLDLGSRASIQAFAHEMRQKFSWVDILVNNAGVMMLPQLTLTEEQFQMQMGVNHLGHFLLTCRLWDLLRMSYNLRIINVSSKAHLRSIANHKQPVVIDYNNLDGKLEYNSGMQYSRSKLANVLFAQELARRVEAINPNARVVSLHPGVVRTELSRYMVTGWKRALIYLLYPILFMVSKNATQGAQTSLYTILEQAENLKNGGYYADCGLSDVNPAALEVINQERLWGRSEELLGIKFEVR